MCHITSFLVKTGIEYVFVIASLNQDKDINQRWDVDKVV